MIVNADPNSNLMENRTIIPTLQHTVKTGETVWYVSGIYARPPAEGVKRAEYLAGWDSKPVIPAWLKDEMSHS